MYFKKGQRFIYVKKPICVLSVIAAVLIVALMTIMIVNPFGPLGFAELFKMKQSVMVMDGLYYEDVDKEKMIDGALAGIAESVNDPYTEYMPKDVAESFLESIESDDYAGVGLYIQKDTETDYVLVSQPIKDSPAQQAGVLAGDKIIKVDGKDVKGYTIDQVAAMMKGPEGTKVSLTVLHKDGKEEELTVTRAVIKRETVQFRMLDDKGNGYIYIEQFGVNTYDEFVKAFNALAEDGMEHLILDLRNNPGGFMDAAVNIADVFVGEELIVYTMNKDGKRTDYMGKPNKTRAPMVILMNGNSASASEVLIGALSHYDIATTVGEKTYGKGVTQMTVPFFDGSLMKVTDSRYYTPAGECIHGVGIQPDFEIKMDEKLYLEVPELDVNKDAQLQKALEIIEEQPENNQEI